MPLETHVGKLIPIQDANPSSYKNKEGYLIVGKTVYSIQDTVVTEEDKVALNFNGSITYHLSFKDKTLNKALKEAIKGI